MYLELVASLRYSISTVLLYVVAVFYDTTQSRPSLERARGALLAGVLDGGGFPDHSRLSLRKGALACLAT